MNQGIVGPRLGSEVSTSARATNADPASGGFVQAGASSAAAAITASPLVPAGEAPQGAPTRPRRSRLPLPIRRLLYFLYERRLLNQVSQRAVPRHVGIILDGNRRHARTRQLTDPRTIYRLGADKLDEVLDWCAELRIPAVTLWVLSTANLDRPTEEVSGILAAIEAKMKALKHDPQIHSRRIRVRAVGRIDHLPASTVAAIRGAEEATAAYAAMTLTIAVAYGGREEIVDAVRAMLQDKTRDGVGLEEIADTLTPETISRYLYTEALPDPDLIIRTSGEVRLSGFLLWQSAFSEYYFSDVFWPAFRKIDFLRAVRAYQQRQRRFGQ
jgi:short-chain Z-isoprenyl diphosphate synthase